MGFMTDKGVQIALDVQSQSPPAAHACAVCRHASPDYTRVYESDMARHQSADNGLLFFCSQNQVMH